MPSTVNSASLDQNLELAKQCSREAALAGFKAAAVATVASAVPTRQDAAMGQGQHQPRWPGPHRLHSCWHGVLHRGGQEDPLAGEAALVRERAGAPQGHLLPGHRPSAPRVLQALSERPSNYRPS
ncbi:early nodulin-related [Zea mays]|uniref:Early nodulin-related n=1 Tax=Zea mays TaxID=4577 RepID=A0A1D6LKT2_MAIZE|nr:early nodulin-related [Zea mays]